MKYIKKFNEIETPDAKVDEGIKEWILAGAIALFSGNAKSSTIQTTPTAIEKPGNDTSLTIDFGTEFESGSYRFSKDKAKDAQQKLTQISSFIQKYKNQNIVISIEGSESQVPNIDAETGRRLPKRGLATMRVAEVEDLINSHMKSLSEKGVFKGSFDTTTKIGSTAYITGENPRQDKFTREQYVKVTLKVVGNAVSANTKANPFSAYASIDQRVFVNNKAVGDVFAKSRSSRDIKDGGGLNTGYQDILLKELAPENEFAKTKKEYNGKYYLIPSNWWNKIRTTSHITPESFSTIKDNLEVDPITGEYCDPSKAKKWIEQNNNFDK